MASTKNAGMGFALAAAVLFGSSAPFSKMLLEKIEPMAMAGILYIASGIGLSIIKPFMSSGKDREACETPLSKKEIPWLLGAVFFGGVAAPIFLMFGMNVSDPATASLLLNFEVVATTLIAFAFFKEHVGARVWVAVAFFVAAGVMLSLDLTTGIAVSAGTLLILGACLGWGLDNNFTRVISIKDPFSIAIIKGLGAGSFSLVLHFSTGGKMPDLAYAGYAALLGLASYGISYVFFIKGLRLIGAARCGAVFSIAPFAGSLLSIAVFWTIPDNQFMMAFGVMAVGALVLAGEFHEHPHRHEPVAHGHAHSHDDLHHAHRHGGIEGEGEGKDGGLTAAHAHEHTHDETEHEHDHAPDAHHDHTH